MNELTLENKIELCNAINTAIAKGYTVKAGDLVVEYGVIITHDKLVSIHQDIDNSFRYVMHHLPNRRVIAYKIEQELDVLYEPVAAETAALKPDLSRLSP